jgi:hypothetical protein
MKEQMFSIFYLLTNKEGGDDDDEAKWKEKIKKANIYIFKIEFPFAYAMVSTMLRRVALSNGI